MKDGLSFSGGWGLNQICFIPIFLCDNSASLFMSSEFCSCQASVWFQDPKAPFAHFIQSTFAWRPLHQFSLEKLLEILTWLEQHTNPILPYPYLLLTLKSAEQSTQFTSSLMTYTLYLWALLHWQSMFCSKISKFLLRLPYTDPNAMEFQLRHSIQCSRLMFPFQHRWFSILYQRFIHPEVHFWFWSKSLWDQSSFQCALMSSKLDRVFPVHLCLFRIWLIAQFPLHHQVCRCCERTFDL